jgi:hypothetical protein
MSNPFYDLYRHEPTKGEILSKFLPYELEQITKKGRMWVIMISSSQSCFVDESSGDTPLFVTNWMNIRSLYSAEGHCYLQYSQLYSVSFELTN